MVGCMVRNRWMGGRKDKNINVWLDGYKLIYEIIYEWLDGYKNQINGRIEKKKLMVGGWWIEKRDGWVDKKIDGWLNGYKKCLKKIDGWLDGQDKNRRMAEWI